MVYFHTIRSIPFAHNEFQKRNEKIHFSTRTKRKVKHLIGTIGMRIKSKVNHTAQIFSKNRFKCRPKQLKSISREYKFKLDSFESVQHTLSIEM